MNPSWQAGAVGECRGVAFLAGFGGSRRSGRATKCHPTALERRPLARAAMRRHARTRMPAGAHLTRGRPVLRRRVGTRGLEACLAVRDGPWIFRTTTLSLIRGAASAGDMTRALAPRPDRLSRIEDPWSFALDLRHGFVLLLPRRTPSCTIGPRRTPRLPPETRSTSNHLPPPAEARCTSSSFL